MKTGLGLLECHTSLEVGHSVAREHVEGGYSDLGQGEKLEKNL